MNAGVMALTDREKETLRLLLSGHEAKSIANELGLSVHTINERLREARRKLGVSSSREAARILAEAEHGTPNFLGDSILGVSGAAAGMANERQGAGYRLAWLAGGILIMLLVIAVAALSSMLQGGSAADTPPAESQHAAAEGAVQSAAADQARRWVALIDGRRWDQSWRASAAIARAQVTADQWTATVKPVREPLGDVSSRVLETATKTNSLPGAPAGEYEVLQFRTDFAKKAGALETVVMVREADGWKGAGYFIR